jgi:uncharacterized membrane-anchored protein YitT (DUF2179 family)
MKSSIIIHRHSYLQSLHLPYPLFFLFFFFNFLLFIFLEKKGRKSSKLLKIFPKVTDVPWPGRGTKFKSSRW